MAKVTDIQDENGVSKEIQDKDLAARTSQSAIASSDYVLLEDTNGAYHKIAKASFTEAVRGALGSVINSVAKGTDIAKLPVLDSNNDLGMGTLANVASVLGGVFISLSSSNDLNDCTERGVVYTWTVDTPTNAPYDYGCMSNILGGGITTPLQICMLRARNNFNIKARYKEGNIWGDWKTIQIQ